MHPALILVVFSVAMDPMRTETIGRYSSHGMLSNVNIYGRRFLQRQEDEEPPCPAMYWL